MSVTRIAADLVPPSISDERGKAFGKMMERAVSDPDFKKLMFERIDTVDARLLRFLVREFSVEEFIEPGMTFQVIRDLLKVSYELHAAKGYIHGVRRGLFMLGMRVVWKQWFRMQPAGQPGTHTVTVFVNKSIFDGQDDLLDARVQRAAQRMIAGMKRHSQDVSFQLGIATASKAGAATGLNAAQVGLVSAGAGPVTGADAAIGAAKAGAALSVVRALNRARPETTPGASAAFAAAARSILPLKFRMEASVT